MAPKSSAVPAEDFDPASSGGLVTLVLDEELSTEIVVGRVLKLLKSEEVEDEAAEVVFEMVLLGSFSLLLVDVVLVDVDVLVLDVAVVVDVEVLVLATGALVDVEVLVPVTEVLVEVEIDAENRSPPKTT